MTDARTMTAGHSPPRMLLIDDDPTQLALSRGLMAAAGFSVVTARSAGEALAAARTIRPDVIVTDVVMPDLDGFTLCSLLRADAALADVPVLLLSAYFREKEDRELAVAAGATALVERTPMLEAEIKAVRDALANGRSVPVKRVELGERYPERVARQLSHFLARTHSAESRYRMLLDHAHEAISVLTPDGVVLEVNHRWEDIRQVPRDKMVGMHIREFAAPGYEQRNAETFLQLLDGSTRGPAVVPIAAADGSILYMEFSTARVHLDGRDVVFSVGRDMTETIEARRRLETSERKYRSLIDNIPDAVWLSELDGRVIFMSAQAETVCGFTVAEMMAGGCSLWFDRVHPSDLEHVREAYARLSRDGGYEAEYRWRRKDGEWIWIHARARVIDGDDGLPLVEGTFTDVTERVRLEEQVRQSQKMEAVGQLTGGIAHDFNNMLAIILGNGRMLMESLAPDDERRVDAVAMVEAGERAAALTRQLLLFSRRQVVQARPIDLNVVVTGVEKMLRRTIGEDITLALRLAESIATVVADAGEIEQILMNMAVNARDAMPRGGRLTIETANVELGAAHAGVSPGRYVMLSVTDSGTGMDAETKRRAFEPFYTTKEQGRGTGLGLSTCYAIVKRCGGHISIYSEPGFGTAFKVYLPQVAGSPAADAVSDIPVDSGGRETILLVEDDEELRKTIHRVLATRGYTVLDAADGNEAAAICASHQGPLDLVLSDMVMPGLNGPDAVERISASRPGVKALFMSGYSDHALLRGGTTQTRVNFIQKPFMPNALAAKIREVLDAANLTR